MTWTYPMTFGVMLGLPILVFGVCSIRPLLALTWFHFAPRVTIAPFSPGSPSPGSPAHRSISAEKRKHRLGFMVETSHDVAYMFDWMLQICLPFLSIMYIGLVKTSLQPFFCKPVIGGTYLLAIAPAISCWDNSEHWGLVGMACVSLVGYVIAIPSMMFAILRYGLKNDQLSTRRWIDVYGYYYKKYQTRYWYWELLILSRRFIFAFVSVVLSSLPALQCWIGLMVCLTTMLAQFSCRPFEETGLNVLDCLCNLSLLIYIVGGIFFLNTEFLKEGWNRDLYVYSILAVNLSVILLCLYLVVDLVRGRRFMNYVAGTLSGSILHEASELASSQPEMLQSASDELVRMCQGDGEVIFVGEGKVSCKVRFISGEEREMTVTHLVRDYRPKRQTDANSPMSPHADHRHQRIADVHVGLKVFHPDEHGVPLARFAQALSSCDPLLAEAFFILGDKNKNYMLETQEVLRIFHIFQNAVSAAPANPLSDMLSLARNAATHRRVSTYAQKRKLMKESLHELFDVAKESVDLFSEALLPEILREWIHSPQRTGIDLATYLCAGEWLSKSLRDDSATSCFSRHPIAKLFRGLVRDAVSIRPCVSWFSPPRLEQVCELSWRCRW